MKQKIVRILAVLLAFAFFALYPAQTFALAEENAQSDEYAGMTNEEKQAQIEQKLKEIDEKLSSLGEQSKETEEYINTLDEKISYLQKQLRYSENKIETTKNKISSLQKQYDENESNIAKLNEDVAKLETQINELSQNFAQNLSLYYQRVRALYISGETSTVALLLTCDDISSLFTRFEMIKRVSKSDKELLQSLQTQAKEISKSRLEMEEKKNTLSNDQVVLKSTEQNLSASITTLENEQSDYNEKQSSYESQKDESDKLLKQLEDEKQTYSEYRNQDQAELEAVNAEIAKAAEEFKKKMEAKKAKTTTTTTTTTTKASTEAQTNENGETVSSEAQTAQQTTEKTTAPVTTKPTTASDPGKLQMTYPVPSQTKITCGFGSAGYSGHTGVDFSCASGSSVVAAESGYVIISTDLTNSDGSYRSYGRYIVIMHDKTDSAGNYVYTLYAHNSSRLVSTGDYVSKGQQIAKSGSTGNSTGPHCHFEVRTPTADYSNCVNPTYYLP